MSVEIVVVLCVAMVGLSFACWTLAQSLSKTSSHSARCTADERRDYHHLIEKLVEHRDAANPDAMARTHAQERAQRVSVDAQKAIDLEVAAARAQQDHANAGALRPEDAMYS